MSAVVGGILWFFIFWGAHKMKKNHVSRNQKKQGSAWEQDELFPELFDREDEYDL